jgi:NADH-quinone oxidoreductase subunit M
MLFGVIGIVYGAMLAFAQTDIKRLIAYTSVSHMGFVLLGIFAFHEMAMQGVVMQMITHGISTGALFVLAGMLKERLHTRDIGQMGGLWTSIAGNGWSCFVIYYGLFRTATAGKFYCGVFNSDGNLFGEYSFDRISYIGLVFSALYSLR